MAAINPKTFFMIKPVSGVSVSQEGFGLRDFGFLLSQSSIMEKILRVITQAALSDITL